MAQLISLLFAVIIHYIFRVTIFLDMHKSETTSLVGFSSLLILMSVVMFLSDLDFMACRYRNASEFMFILLETIICIFLIEVFVVLIWSKLEVGIELVLKTTLMENELNLYHDMGGDNLIGFIIVLISASFTTYAAIVTGFLAKSTVFVYILKLNIKNYFKSIKDNNNFEFMNGRNERNIQYECCEPRNIQYECCEPVQPDPEIPQKRSRSRKTKKER